MLGSSVRIVSGHLRLHGAPRRGGEGGPQRCRNTAAQRRVTWHDTTTLRGSDAFGTGGETVEFDDFMVGKIADVNRDFFERFLVLQLVVRLKGYSNRVIIGGLSLILVFWIFSFRSPGTGVLVNAGRSTTFLVARAGGEPLHFFHKSSIAAHGKQRKTTRGSKKLRGFGQWIRVGWPSLSRRLGGGPVPLVSSQKRDWFLHGN